MTWSLELWSAWSVTVHGPSLRYFGKSTRGPQRTCYRARISLDLDNNEASRADLVDVAQQGITSQDNGCLHCSGCCILDRSYEVFHTVWHNIHNIVLPACFTIWQRSLSIQMNLKRGKVAQRIYLAPACTVEDCQHDQSVTDSGRAGLIRLELDQAAEPCSGGYGRILVVRRCVPAITEIK